jgi:serine protease Do
MKKIGDIQSDIERDLNGQANTSKLPQASEEMTTAEWLKIDREIDRDDYLRDKYMNDVSLEGLPVLAPSTPPVAEFYRETIKPAPPTPKKSWLKTAVATFLICTVGMGTLGFGIGAGAAFVWGEQSEPITIMRNADETAEGAVFTTGATYVFESLEPTVAGLSDVVELLAPAVVGITTHRDEERFPFGVASYGSGIIFASGADRIFIATSLYVVRWGYSWDISIAGSEPIAARPVGLNAYYDLAVAYVYKEELLAAGIDSVSFASFGDSDAMRIGDVVLAIGNAMGEGTSVTRGIISAAEREVLIPGRVHPLRVLQTDAAINYGNSGGPLINTLGEIVGININQATGLSIGATPVEGMGYSISSNIAAPVLHEIIANYRAPAIGIMGVSLADDEYRMAEYWGIPELGVRVISVQQDRPAYHAGIRPNDVITGFDGQPIFEMSQLLTAIRSREIGDTVEVRILRGGSFAITVQLELGIMLRETF